MSSLFARVRIHVARHPAIRWAAVAALTAVTAAVVTARLDAAEAERRTWGDTSSVLVATADHRPGDPVRARREDRPVAVVPHGALDEIPAGATTRQFVAAGAVLEPADVGTDSGPAAQARPGEAVVAVHAGDATAADRGLAVDVVADGVVLAHDGTIVAVGGDMVHVAVDRRAAPAIAAAALVGSAAVVYLP